MATIRRVHTKVEYSLASPDPGPATWVEIPMNRLFGEEAQYFTTDSETAEMFDGSSIRLNSTGTATYPVMVDPEAAYMTALKAADDAGDSVWVRETFSDGTTAVIGGTSGARLNVRFTQGTFLLWLVGLSVSGSNVDDVIEITAAS